MEELGLNLGVLRGRFDESETGQIVVVTPTADLDEWITELVDAVRRCYATDDFIRTRAAQAQTAIEDVIKSLLPERGSIMSGDHGEILAFLYLGTRPNPSLVAAPKKWRLKNDRTKAAPYSDIIQFVVPEWPNASDADELVCAEVKSKALAGNSTPIADAIADSHKDETARLAKTLQWLRDRAILGGSLDSTPVAMIDRFRYADEYPPAEKQFWAVAVISDELLTDELDAAPAIEADDPHVVVIALPNLKDFYERVYSEIPSSLPET